MSLEKFHEFSVNTEEINLAQCGTVSSNTNRIMFHYLAVSDKLLLYRVFTVLTRSRFSRVLPPVLLAKYGTVVDTFWRKGISFFQRPLF